jgi:quercetin dioxygenase-like cupin family protein
MVAPHNHPRATEFLFNIAGPPLAATSFLENGSPIFNGEVSAGEVVVLPMGSVHFVTNTGCDPVMITAGFK